MVGIEDLIAFLTSPSHLMIMIPSKSKFFIKGESPLLFNKIPKMDDSPRDWKIWRLDAGALFTTICHDIVPPKLRSKKLDKILDSYRALL